jgi:hypothetical protein
MEPVPGDVAGRSPFETGKRSGRDARGRFTRGNRGGPGNPFTRRLAALRRALLNCLTHDDLQTTARKLIEQARSGDLAAIKLLFAYIVGKPVDAVDPDRVDLEEFQLYCHGQAHLADVLGILHTLPPDKACALVRLLLPYTTGEVTRQLAALLGLRPETADGDSRPRH